MIIWTCTHAVRGSVDILVPNKCSICGHCISLHNTVCLLCDQQPETIDHLMVQCPTSRSIWFQVLADKGLSSFCPASSSLLRGWWSSLGCCRPRKRKRELTSLAIAVCPNGMTGTLRESRLPQRFSSAWFRTSSKCGLELGERQVGGRSSSLVSWLLGSFSVIVRYVAL